jgi:P27 family predicted phage terminase small subunit
VKGPRPKPFERQIAEGDPRKRGVNKLQELANAAPPATKGLPECPARLQGLAREVWEFWAEELAKMNLDARPDAMMLEGACCSFANAAQAQEELNENGGGTVKEPVVIDGAIVGYKFKPHPAVGVWAKSWQLCKAFCSEFGLSPVSRTRLTIDKKDRTPDLGELLAAPRQTKAKPEHTVQ